MIFSSFISGSPAQSQQPSRRDQDAASQQPELVTSLVNAKRRELRSAQEMEQQVATSAAGYAQLLGGATERLRKLIWTTPAGAPTDAEEQPRPPATAEPAGPAHKRPAANWQLECKFTLNEVRQHATLDDCWMVIFDKVYDITEFVHEHPGGDFILFEYAGRDATQPFLSSRHGSSAHKMLDKYWIGILVDEELYYSNNSSYCSVYSSLSWRSTPTLEADQEAEEQAAAGVAAATEEGEPIARALIDFDRENQEAEAEAEVEAEAEAEAEAEDDEEFEITSQHSADCVTLREEQPTAEQFEFTAIGQRQLQLPRQHSNSVMPHNNNTNAPVASTQTSTQQLLMIEHNLGGASFFLESGRPDESDSDVDSDFGDEQTECNTCNGPPAPTPTQPRPIHRSASAASQQHQQQLPSIANTTTTTTAVLRWQLRNRDRLSLVTQQFH